VEARDHRQHDVQTPLPDLLPALWLARTAGPSAGIQERRDPRLAPRGRGLAPTSQPTTLLLARPGRPRGVDPPPTKARPIMPLPDGGVRGSWRLGFQSLAARHKAEVRRAEPIALPALGEPGACAWLAAGDVVPGVALAFLRTKGASIYAHGH
jgi:hypothetical protein